MPEKEEEPTTLLQQYQNISNHAHTEINSIHSVFKLVLTIGSSMLVIIAGFGTYFTVSSIKDFKQDISNIRTDAHIEVSRLKSETRGTVKTLKEEVLTRIEKELNEDSIKTIIAEKITNEVLAKTITIKTEELNKKINNIDKQLYEALKKNEVLSDYMMTNLKAQSDDSEAYEQLARWANNPEYESYPFRDIAFNSYDSIRRTYIERLIPASRTIAWQKGVDPKTFTYDNFKNFFKDMKLSFHADLVHLIRENENLSERKKMEFLVDVISGTNTSNSLNAKYFAGNILAEKLGAIWQPFDYKPIIEKWEDYLKGTTTTK